MKAVIIGAGPAGLTAAVELIKHKIPVTVIEKSPHLGGIARTEVYKGYRFDIGGHRFFTKIEQVDKLWHDWLGPDFLNRPRLSRIFYAGKFFDYPLKIFKTLAKLGPVESVLIAASYGWSQLSPHAKEENLEQWVSNRFGRRLYRLFFKTYTEKVWGLPCTEIRAEWAAQRIKDLSIGSILSQALGLNRGRVVKTLIEEFNYPRLGPGQMWQEAAKQVIQSGNQVLMNCLLDQVCHQAGQVTQVVYLDEGGMRQVLVGTDFISSIPLPELILKLSPPAPSEVQAAARALKYRDFLTVVLILDHPNLFQDNWLYIHDSSVKVGRIQNFKNWSQDLVPNKQTSSLGLEYFCTEGDDLWRLTDQELIALGAKEIQQIGLNKGAQIIDGTVVRQPKAYPVYDREYAEHLAVIKNFLASLPNLQTIGRNGLHKYNNQDHSMLTAILAVENILGATHDLWEVNTERSFHEEVRVPKDQE